MSGFEAIGLALGIFPLVISALEHYRSACKVVGRIVHVEAEYRKSLDDVKDEELIYRMTLEELLLPLTTNGSFEDWDLETLLVDPSSPGWKDESVEEALEQRLGPTYERFLEISSDLQRLISRLLFMLIDKKPHIREKIQEKSEREESRILHSVTFAAGPKAQERPKTKTLSATAFHSFLKRQWQYREEQLQFGWGSAQRQEILRDIQTCNKKLERLLEKSDRITQFKETKAVVSSPRAVKSLLQYWQHADRIHALMHQSFGCTCKEKHCAHLWLQHRTSPAFEFKLLLLWAPKMMQGQQHPPWDRQGLLITWKTESMNPRQSALIRRDTSNFSTASTAVSTQSGGSKKRRVGFAGLLTHSSPSASQTVVPIPPRQSQQSIVAQQPNNTDLVEEISTLCDTISACGMQSACIGSLSDRVAGRQYSVFSQPEQKITGDEITLHDVLHDSPIRRLKRSDRFRIALALASSHLQLHSTRWARKQWEAVDIRFPIQTVSREIMFDKPFVSADFNGDLFRVDQRPRRTDRSFACLGIMLLELLFGTCLEDHDLWQQLGEGNRAITMFRLMVARQWADDVEDEAGEHFSDAVMWCLNESPATLEGEQWRKDLADRVVLPIQNCCEWIQSKPGAC